MAVVFTDAGEAYTVTRLVTDPAASATFVGIGTGSAAGGSFTKTTNTLPTEVETRAAATASSQTTTSTGDTARYVGTQTMGSARNITCGGLFDASTSGNLLIGSDGLTINLASGDSLQQTFNLQMT